jgi:hypothetical protein
MNLFFATKRPILSCLQSWLNFNVKCWWWEWMTCKTLSLFISFHFFCDPSPQLSRETLNTRSIFCRTYFSPNRTLIKKKTFGVKLQLSYIIKDKRGYNTTKAATVTESRKWNSNLDRAVSGRLKIVFQPFFILGCALGKNRWDHNQKTYDYCPYGWMKYLNALNYRTFKFTMRVFSSKCYIKST